MRKLFSDKILLRGQDLVMNLKDIMITLKKLDVIRMDMLAVENSLKQPALIQKL